MPWGSGDGGTRSRARRRHRLRINLLLTLVLVSVLWRYAVREQLVRPDLADQDVRMLTKRLTPTLGVYVGLIVVGVFLPIVAVIGYLALARGLRRRPKDA